jgi:hypothetical protein
MGGNSYENPLPYLPAGCKYFMICQRFADRLLSLSEQGVGPWGACQERTACLGLHVGPEECRPASSSLAETCNLWPQPLSLAIQFPSPFRCTKLPADSTPVRTGPKAEPRIRQQKVERSNGKPKEARKKQNEQGKPKEARKMQKELGKQKGARKRQKGARKKQKGKKMEISRPFGYIVGY